MKFKIVLMAVLALFVFATPVFAEPDILVYVDGEQVTFPDQEPYIDDNNRTLVPVRFPAEEFGAAVDWIGPEQRVDITHEDEGKEVQLWVNQTT